MNTMQRLLSEINRNFENLVSNIFSYVLGHIEKNG